jgi:hypothetical protein
MAGQQCHRQRKSVLREWQHQPRGFPSEVHGGKHGDCYARSWLRCKPGKFDRLQRPECKTLPISFPFSFTKAWTIPTAAPAPMSWDRMPRCSSTCRRGYPEGAPLTCPASIDEISIHNALDDSLQSNFVSLKVGGKFSNCSTKIFSSLPNTRAPTRSHTGTMCARQHLHRTTTASEIYLGDNAQEGFISFGWKPLSKLLVEVSYNIGAEKGRSTITTAPGATGKGWTFLMATSGKLKSSASKRSTR